MKYVVAVSGGVDSVALLDMLVKRYGAQTLVVAHFDHAIRAESSLDADFVHRLADRYGCAFVSEREELGASASEALARSRRYAFLYAVTARFNGAKLVTAHHLDDLVETVVLQIQRGTGWRGLTPFGAGAERPLLSMEKREVLDYARLHGLEWREDETNQSAQYARNRIRPAVAELPTDVKWQIRTLYEAQWSVRRSISSEVGSILRPYDSSSRYLVIMADPSVRRELLRDITNGRLTRPQLDRMALAICAARPKTTLEAGDGVKVHFTTRTFEVELIKLDKR